MKELIKLTPQERTAINESIQYLKNNLDYFAQMGSYASDDVNVLYPAFRKLIKWGFTSSTLPFEETYVLGQALDSDSPATMKCTLRDYLPLLQRLFDQYTNQTQE